MRHLATETRDEKQEFLAPLVEIVYFAAEDDVIYTSNIELPGDDFENP